MYRMVLLALVQQGLADQPARNQLVGELSFKDLNARWHPFPVLSRTSHRQGVLVRMVGLVRLAMFAKLRTLVRARSLRPGVYKQIRT